MTCASSVLSTMRHTPVPASISTNSLHIIKRLQQAHSFLLSAPSLAPNEAVNCVFSELVHLCIASYPATTVHAVLEHPLTQAMLPSLRALCSQGEFLLELVWAQRMTKHAEQQEGQKMSVLQEFVYHDNYQQLVRLELHCLLGLGARLGRVVFVGSGPLPLSSILLAPHCSHPVNNVDHSLDAIHTATCLARALQVQHKMRFFHGDAAEYPAYQDADVVILGALVGADGDAKASLLERIAVAMSPGAILLVRSAHALRTVLYPPLLDSAVPACLVPMLEVHPRNEVVNSVVLFQKK